MLLIITFEISAVAGKMMYAAGHVLLRPHPVATLRKATSVARSANFDRAKRVFSIMLDHARARTRARVHTHTRAETRPSQTLTHRAYVISFYRRFSIASPQGYSEKRPSARVKLIVSLSLSFSLLLVRHRTGSQRVVIMRIITQIARLYYTAQNAIEIATLNEQRRRIVMLLASKQNFIISRWNNKNVNRQLRRPLRDVAAIPW